ncbi:unnamed protein product, partial [Mesorhabditis spiculigera]
MITRVHAPRLGRQFQEYPPFGPAEDEQLSAHRRRHRTSIEEQVTVTLVFSGGGMRGFTKDRGDPKIERVRIDRVQYEVRDSAMWCFVDVLVADLSCNLAAVDVRQQEIDHGDIETVGVQVVEVGGARCGRAVFDDQMY